MYIWLFSKSTWDEQPIEYIRIFTCICVYLFICVCVSRLLAKRKTIKTSNLVHLLPWTLSKTGCLFFGKMTPGPYLKRVVCFSKKWPWGPLVSKTCRVTWIFRISLRLPCQNPREASSRSRIFLISLVNVCIYLCIYLFMYVFIYLGRASWSNENGTDLKFGTHTPTDFI